MEIAQTTPLTVVATFIGTAFMLLLGAIPLGVIVWQQKIRLKMLPSDGAGIGNVVSQMEAQDLCRPTFSVKAALIVTTLAALLLARGVDEPAGWLEHPIVREIRVGFNAGACRGSVLVLACWSLLGTRVQIWGLTLTYVGAAFSSYVMWLYTTNSLSSPSYDVVTDLVALTIALATLAIYRRNGLRWVQD